ncbi:class I SAM-dependent DNA methyltransferase [Microbispora triticiradicis]|uniref:Class I SAM-dependent methyltransferase n=2 Tax=Microbispora TaxID=2005 RepID=A0ABY3LNL1_9ACTN|nr:MULTISPECIES: class I SAM-dependent methyltransferase [Microbispora]TLP54855.1 class I SAM-dependent methyltransferase [Microbispora fusca]TYB43144.1 class I SAM-dependent methyltransferase [Microbispora tritici]
MYARLAEEYDALLGELAESTWRQGIVAELAGLSGGTGTRIADIGAGTGIGGRLMRELRPDFQIVGLDRAASMLERARGSYRRTVVADASEGLPFEDREFDVLVSGFDTLNYFDPAVLGVFLADAARCLRESGLLIFDYSSPRLLREEWRDLEYEEDHADGRVRWSHRYDASRDRCVSTVERYSESGELKWREQHAQYALDAYSLAGLAEKQGLSVERVRDLDKPVYTPLANTHIWVMSRQRC